MILQSTDIAIVLDLLRDYQHYVKHYPAFFAKTVGQVVSPRTVHPWLTLQARLDNYGMMVFCALTGEHPQGFRFSVTHDNLWYVYSLQTTLSIGPTTEFQARLWAFQQAYLAQAIEENYTSLDGRVRDTLELATTEHERGKAWHNLWWEGLEQVTKGSEK